MLRISRLADYATEIVCYLGTLFSQEHVKVASTANIAGALNLPEPTVSKILKRLVNAGVLTSTRGASGGYQLARDPHQISVADIISAIDQVPSLTDCCSEEITCERKTHCCVKSHWQAVNQVVFNALSGMTVAHMAKGEL